MEPHWNEAQAAVHLFIWSEPLYDTQDLFAGSHDLQECVVKTFNSDAEASAYNSQMLNLGSIPNVPQFVPMFEGLLRLDTRFHPIDGLFAGIADVYHASGLHGSFYQHMKSCFEQVFFGSLRGMRGLLKKGFVVRNVRRTTTIFHCGFDNNQGILRPYFLDIVPLPHAHEERVEMIVRMITDIRDSMRYVMSLSGHSYDDLQFQADNGVPEAVSNFLIKAGDPYVRFMCQEDPDYVLFDPMIWETEDKITRSWHRHAFFADSLKAPKFRKESLIYDKNFPQDWKDRIDIGSFFDLSHTRHRRGLDTNKMKIDLADELIKLRNNFDGDLGNLDHALRGILDAYYAGLDTIQNRRGLDSYHDGDGMTSIVKIQRNCSQHHNDTAWDMRASMQTLDEIVDMVDNVFGFSSSYLFWHMNEQWYLRRVRHWIDHKNMMKGELCWDRVKR